MEGNDPTISVIIPVYNAEKYLRLCLDSLISQTYKDFEIILINDGSTDNSSNLCDEYSGIDNRIRVIHKKNGGVSSARQVGIDSARGTYTIYVDSDDWVEPNMLEELYNTAVSSKADMVICDYYMESLNEIKLIRQRPSGLEHDIVLADLFKTLHGSCCNKLIKRDCYSRYNISFPMNLSVCEDLYVIASLLKHNITVEYLPKAFYHYILNNNDNSLSKIVNSSYDNDLYLLKCFTSLMQNENCIKLCKNKFSFNIIANSYQRKEFSSIVFCKKCIKFINSILYQNNVSLYYRLKLFMSCIGFYKCMLLIDKINDKTEK